MTSPAAVEHVSTLIDSMEEEGAPEVTASCRDRGMLEVWAQELHERGYKIHTHWTRRTWGVAVSVRAALDKKRMKWPVLVKPWDGAASKGVVVVDNRREPLPSGSATPALLHCSP